MRNPRMMTGAALAAAALMLAGCSRSAPEQPEDGNMVEAAPADTATPEPLPTAEPSPAPAPAPVDTNAAAEAPPEDKVTPDAQMLDDAEATGMTARVTRDAPPADNGQAPQ